MREKYCIRCGGLFQVCFFKRDNHPDKQAMPGNGYRSVCKGCEGQKKLANSKKRRWQKKSRSTLRRHAKKYIENGLINSIDAFIEAYGWHVDQMAHDAEQSYSNGCQYCFKTFSEMGMGTGDITLDIQDPRLPPLYGRNTRWICKDCNTRKAEHFTMSGLCYKWNGISGHVTKIA